ncbi:MAG: aldo/keto reductase [Alphaproteobacteria bacterium]|nr:aldo/keto reductase [Alphaproteobacteria bacterium]
MTNIEKTRTLANNLTIPTIGFGTWKIEEGETAERSVHEAIKAGYTLIDTATIYGNEASVGRAIKQSDVPRENLFITTKLWNSERGYDKTLRAFEDSLKLLQLDVLDLYLIHWPAARGPKEEWAKTNAQTWRAFETLYKDGLIKAIGVSNFKPHHLTALMEQAEIKPMVNQIEFHPGFRQEATYDFCKKENIIIEAWAPLGTGRMLKNETLEAFAKKYGKSVAQLCIRWCLQNETIPLPKSVHEQRIRENLAVFDFEISEDDMALINSMPDFGSSGADPDTVTF